MKLSNSNSLLTFYAITQVPDKYGGVNQKYNQVLTLFGKLSLVHIDHKNHHTYTIVIASNSELIQYSNQKLIVAIENKYYLVKNIKIDKKLIIITCNDYQYPTDSI